MDVHDQLHGSRRPPGRYRISAFVFYRGGYGFDLPHTLTVT